MWGTPSMRQVDTQLNPERPMRGRLASPNKMAGWEQSGRRGRRSGLHTYFWLKSRPPGLRKCFKTTRRVRKTLGNKIFFSVDLSCDLTVLGRGGGNKIQLFCRPLMRFGCSWKRRSATKSNFSVDLSCDLAALGRDARQQNSSFL